MDDQKHELLEGRMLLSVDGHGRFLFDGLRFSDSLAHIDVAVQSLTNDGLQQLAIVLTSE